MDQILESLSALLIPVYDGEGRPDTLGGILWCIFFGVVLVFLSVSFQNVTLGKAVKILREKGASEEGSALPLSELGRLPTFAYRGGQKMLGTVEKDGKIFLYLPEESEKKADALLKTGSAPLWLCFLELAALYLVLLLIYHLLPWAISLF